MRRVLVDRLAVVLGVLAVGGHGDLPVDALGLELVGVAGVEVVPVDADRVSPFSTVAGVDWTGLKLPFAFSLPKKSRPGWMLSSEPPLASAAAYTPPKAEPDLVGSPFSATWPLYSGLSRSAKVVGQSLTLASQPMET